jgi:integrase/recombinase XerD
MYHVNRAKGPEGKVALLDPGGQTVTIVDEFLEYLTARACSPNTVTAYAYDLMYLWTFIFEKDLSWDALSAGQAAEFFVYLRCRPSGRRGCGKGVRVVSDLGRLVPSRLSAATVNRIMVGVAAFYDWAVLSGHFSGRNPISKVEDVVSWRVLERHRPFLDGISRHVPATRQLRVKTVYRLPRPMSEQQIEALLNNLKSLRDKSLMLLMLNAGLRPGEVLNLQLGDIAYGRHRITVRWRNDHPKGARTKSRRERVVDLCDGTTLSMLNSYVMQERPREAETGFVFLIGGNGKHRNEPMSYDALVRLFARACSRAGIREPWVTPHALRHTHATRMWEGGMRELTLQRRLGHASPESTRIYTRVSDAIVVAEYRRALGLDASGCSTGNDEVA